MKKSSFNSGWMYRNLESDGKSVSITLPHDAMISEKREQNNPGGANIGWFAGGDYIYEKTFFIPKEAEKRHIEFEFEGVYKHARVFLNGQEAGECFYGYTDFIVDADPYLKYGEDNLIQVVAYNSDQPNSRWYTGSGIYRPVSIHEGPKEYIPQNGIKIRTVSIDPVVIEIELKVKGSDKEAKIEILDQEKCLITKATMVNAGYAFKQFILSGTELWSPQTPKLYTCRITYGEDCAEETFGIRTIGYDRENGFQINGKREILRGACIHHDNGLLGACAYPDAEERKVRLLKENGYNAIRSAHNPCSKAILEACDRLGMLMLDEFSDCWYIHKTEHDYVKEFMDNWEYDLKRMVDKDYNHPSVIMYSIGNEVAETSQPRGIDLTREMTDVLHSQDDTRPVTCGINIFFNLLSSMGMGVYSNEKAEKDRKKTLDKMQKDNKGTEKKKKVGSEFYNSLAGLLGDTTMKVGATLHGCDQKTRDAFEHLDIAGYNYGILRYEGDFRKYPERLIVGSETFCKDAYRFYRHARIQPGLIGDFVWTGIDYLGEAGLGAWEYEDYAPYDIKKAGWLTAGAGRIDITGKPLAEAGYTKTAFGLTNKPVIAVVPVYQKGKHSPSAWKMTNAMESWTWDNCDGLPAYVEVFARAAEIELLVNGRSVGREKYKRDCRFTFKTTYESGEITAIAYGKDGSKISQNSLFTAGEETILSIEPEKEKIKEGQLAFIRLRYTDHKGILKPMERHNLKITEIRGGKLLAMGNACPYQDPETSYLTPETETYYGEAMVILQTDGTEEIYLQVTDGEHTAETTIAVKN